MLLPFVLLGFLPPWPSPAGGEWGPPEESPAAAVVGLYGMAFCMMTFVYIYFMEGLGGVTCPLCFDVGREEERRRANGSL